MHGSRRIQANAVIGAGREEPRLHRMKRAVEHANAVHDRVAFEHFERYEQRILGDVAVGGIRVLSPIPNRRVAYKHVGARSIIAMRISISNNIPRHYSFSRYTYS